MENMNEEFSFNNHFNEFVLKLQGVMAFCAEIMFHNVCQLRIMEISRHAAVSVLKLITDLP